MNPILYLQIISLLSTITSSVWKWHSCTFESHPESVDESPKNLGHIPILWLRSLDIWITSCACRVGWHPPSADDLPMNLDHMLHVCTSWVSWWLRNHLGCGSHPQSANNICIKLLLQRFDGLWCHPYGFQAHPQSANNISVDLDQIKLLRITSPMYYDHILTLQIRYPWIWTTSLVCGWHPSKLGPHAACGLWLHPQFLDQIPDDLDHILTLLVFVFGLHAASADDILIYYNHILSLQMTSSWIWITSCHPLSPYNTPVD